MSGSGAIILSTAGRLVGSYFGGPIGGIIGAFAGAAIGGALDRPGKQRQDAPPLVDLKILGTDYGQPIPWVRGRVRLAGQMWWNTDRRPIYTTTTSGGGGKGAGGAPETESTSVTYEMDALYGLTTDNGKPLSGDKIVGIARIWDNGKLIWSLSGDSEGADIAASEEVTRWNRLTVYKGAADQLPDPTYEAAMLADGKKPTAYRHRATVFIEGLQLGSGGGVPNLTFEVIVDGASAPLYDSVFQLDGTVVSPNGIGELAYDGSRYIWAHENALDVRIFDAASHEFSERTISVEGRTPFGLGEDFSGETYFGFDANRNGFCFLPVPEYDLVYIHASANLDIGFGSSQIFTPMPYRLSTGELLGEGAIIHGELLAVDPLRLRGLMYRSVNPTSYLNLYIVSLDGQFKPVGEIYHLTSDDAPFGVVTSPINASIWAIIGRGICDGSGTFWFRSANDKFLLLASPFAFEELDPGADVFDGNAVGPWEYDSTRDCIYYFSEDHRYLKKLDCSSQTVSRIYTFSTSAADANYIGYGTVGAQPGIGYDSEADAISCVYSTGGGAYWSKINPDTGALENAVLVAGADAVAFYGDIVPRGVTVYGAANNSSNIAAEIFGIASLYDALSGTCPTVAEVVSGICARCGLAASQYDVTDLSSISRDVCSFPWSQVSGGRDPLALLMSAYYFELTVSDKIYFRTRGGSSVATIPYDDLGATEASSQGATEPLVIKLASDIELPARKALTYSNLDNDYQNDTQLSDRLISSVDSSIEALSMSMGFVPSEAKAIVNTMLRDQAMALITTEISVLGHYAAIEPCDVVTVGGPNGESYRMRATKKRDAFPVLGLSLVLDDASVLADVGITDLDYTSSTTVPGPVRTILELLDIPILRDADDDAGFYGAAKGSGTPYAGSALYKSTNAIDFDDRVATFTQPAVIGETTVALGDWTGPRIIDEFNSITVNVGSGTLSSSTRALVLDSGANAVLVGSEVIQVINWELLSTAANGDKTYKGTRLLRGCRGTEWAMVDHAVGETFVELSSSTLRRVPMDNSEIGFARYYKGVPVGRTVAATESETFTNAAVGLKPFAPIDLRGSRDGSNNLTITWERRSRLSVRMIGTLGINVPLGEDAESYEIDIYEASSPYTVVRTLTSSTPTVTYTAAQQTADGLTPGNDVDVGVFQISATVDRGYELRGTV